MNKVVVEYKNKYILDIDAVLLAFSVLKKLGAGNIKSFDERLKSQKVQYLAQVFGVSPAYGFSLYVHGPYSPSLTKDLFTIYSDKKEPDSSDFLADKLRERFDALRKLVDGKSNRELELITTLHLFSKVFGWSKEKATSQLVELKKASEKEIIFSFDQISQIP